MFFASVKERSVFYTANACLRQIPASCTLQTYLTSLRRLPPCGLSKGGATPRKVKGKFRKDWNRRIFPRSQFFVRGESSGEANERVDVHR